MAHSKKRSKLIGHGFKTSLKQTEALGCVLMTTDRDNIRSRAIELLQTLYRFDF